MTYGTRIKQAREEMFLTQEQLAEELDVTRQAVSKWEADLSRPTREKLDKLSQILNIPPETWAEIDAENAAAAQPPDTSRPWKIATAALAVVCAVLAILLRLAIPYQTPADDAAEDVPPPEEVQAPVEAPSVPEQEPGPILPDSFPLFQSHDYSFGDWRVGIYDPAEIPFLEDGGQVVENELWCGWFPDGTRLSLVPVTAQWDTKYTNIYLLYAPPIDTTGGELEYHIFYRIGEDYTGTDRGSPDAVPFTNILGYDGFKINISASEGLYRSSHYIIQGPDGTPRMMTSTGSPAQEADVDDDGVLEIVVRDNDQARWQITDTRKGEEGAFTYTVFDNNVTVPGEYAFSLDPDRGGFLITDGANTIISRCVLRDSALFRIPATDFSVKDYPDAAGTEITFVTDYSQSQSLSDGMDPDAILPYNPDVRISHRQQAYLALQELYNMTGLKVDDCCCAASEYGVVFSMLPDGFNERAFYSAHFGADHGAYGDPIPSFYICWKELDNDWSPLSFSQAAPPEGESVDDQVRWYYERMSLYNTGEIDRLSCLPIEEELWRKGFEGAGDFYLTDGSLFNVGYQMIGDKTVLVNLYGPYPDGIVLH